MITGPGRLARWEWRTGVRRWSVEIPSRLSHVNASLHGQQIFARCANGDLFCLAASDGRIVAEAKGAASESGFRFAAGGKQLAAWNQGENPRIATNPTAGTAAALEHKLPVACQWGFFSPNGDLFCTASTGDQVQIWDSHTGRALSAPLGPPRPLDATFHGDQTLLAATCADGKVRVWDWRGGRLMGPPLAPRAAVEQFRFAGNDDRVVTLHTAEAPWVWDTVTGKPVAQLPVLPGFSRWHSNLVVHEEWLIACNYLVDRDWLQELDEAAAYVGPESVAAEVLAGQEVDPQGSAVRLTAAEWHALWVPARRRHPQMFEIDGFLSDLDPWHRRRAKTLECASQWDAALWHLAQLEAHATPRDRAHAARLRAFVRAWRFCPSVEPWLGADEERLDPVSEEKLRAIAAEASAAPLWRSRGPYVDFLLRYPQSSSLSLGYAQRTLRAEESCRLQVFAGSDDSLRAWWNGREVYSMPFLGGAAMDYSSFEVDVVPGENTLLVEVGQSGANWGLYLRLADERGQPVELTDDNRLVFPGDG